MNLSKSCKQRRLVGLFKELPTLASLFVSKTSLQRLATLY